MDEQPNPIIQPEQPAQQPQKPSNKSWQIAAIVVAGILIVGGISYGSYYLWQKSTGNTGGEVCTDDAKLCPDGSSVGRTGPNCEFAACPSVSPSLSPVVDETVGWKTYTNAKHNYQIKVPQDFYNRAKPSAWAESSSDDSLSSLMDHQWYIMISYVPDSLFYNPPVGTKLVNWLKDYKRLPDSLASLSEPNFELNGIPAVKFFSIRRPGAYNQEYVYFIRDNKLFQIDVLEDTYADENGKTNSIAVDDVKKLSNLILSTFKFIDSTADWQTYKNEQYGFEVRYPNKISDLKYGSESSWMFEENNNKDYILFGPPESRQGGFVWEINVQRNVNLENLVKNQGVQFNDRKESREDISIDNLPALLVTVTTEQYKDWIFKKIYIEIDDKIYSIGNGAIDIKEFRDFYKSFKFIR